jgi:uncharacterized membrane protein YgcG
MVDEGIKTIAATMVLLFAGGVGAAILVFTFLGLSKLIRRMVLGEEERHFVVKSGRIQPPEGEWRQLTTEEIGVMNSSRRETHGRKREDSSSSTTNFTTNFVTGMIVGSSLSSSNDDCSRSSSGGWTNSESSSSYSSSSGSDSGGSYGGDC